MHWLAETRQLLHFLTGIICYLEEKSISLQKNSVMKFNKIYKEWVTYLKKRGIYGQYMMEYARVNEYLTYRALYREYHVYVIDSSNHKFLNSKDLLIENKSDENMTYTELADGIQRFQCNMFFLSKHNWITVLEDFGVEFGYYNRPRYIPDVDDLWSDYDTYSTHRVARPTRHRGREEANIGQWYDVYYRDINRNRNRFINNVRWRR